MLPRLLKLLKPPDFVSLTNAGLGFIAIGALFRGEVQIGAQLILIAGVTDGLDGLIARHTRTSSIGVELDSLADVVSFGIVPAFFVYTVSSGSYPLISLISVVYIISAIVRLAAYNVHDFESAGFTGVPSTLAGTIIVTLYLAGTTSFLEGYTAPFFLAITVVFSYLMLTEIEYPDLRDRDALVMGAVMALAGIVPDVFYSVFPRILLFFLLIFLLFSPFMYWNGRAQENKQGVEAK